ncbi:MAG TPA: lytic transglycosylase domain-containing protein [Rhizomicrobium sp.]
MDALKAASLCALFFAPSQAGSPCAPPAQISSPQIEHWQLLIAEASHRFNVPENWIAAVMRLESAGLLTLNGKPITSSAGAMGLMQLMPATYADMRARYGLGPDPYEPHDNVMAGAAYLREMFVRYGYPNLFAAYQAGPKLLDAYLAGVKPLPEATRNYLDSLISSNGNASAVSEKPISKAAQTTPDLLFFVRAESPKAPSDGSISVSEISNSDAASDKKIDSGIVESNSIFAHDMNELFVPLGERPH